MHLAMFHATLHCGNLLILRYLPSIEEYRVVMSQLFSSIKYLKVVGAFAALLQTQHSVPWIPAVLGACVASSLSDDQVIFLPNFFEMSSSQSVETLEEKRDFLRVICTFLSAFERTLINFFEVFGNKFSCNEKNEDFQVILNQFQQYLSLKY